MINYEKVRKKRQKNKIKNVACNNRKKLKIEYTGICTIFFLSFYFQRYRYTKTMYISFHFSLIQYV